jgi:hypothetical protein
VCFSLPQPRLGDSATKEAIIHAWILFANEFLIPPCKQNGTNTRVHVVPVCNMPRKIGFGRLHANDV